MALTVAILAVVAGAQSTDSTSTSAAAADLQHPPESLATPRTRIPTPELSLTDPSSAWVMVDKTRPLTPADYVPEDLVVPAVPALTSGQEAKVRAGTARAMTSMFAAAQRDGITLTLVSGYRSYTGQKATYAHWQSLFGTAGANERSAHPGYSEHQTGLALDVGNADGSCSIATCFSKDPAGKWVAAHGHKFGFIVRYPKGKAAITGYAYEPWHLRYVGVRLATAMHDFEAGTLEEFFKLAPAPHYR